MNPKDTEDLEEAKDFVKEFKNRLPSKVDQDELGCRSKLPWKALSIRDPLLYRIIELADAACRLYEANLLASAFTLTRSAFETAAMLHWLYKQMDKAVKSRRVGKDLDEVLMRALLGRKDRHIQPINVLTFIHHLDKQFKGMGESYAALSEYAHPNWFGVMSLYGKPDPEKKGRCLNLHWPELGTRAGEGLPLLCAALVLFKFCYDQTSNILPAFIQVCDDNLPR